MAKLTTEQLIDGFKELSLIELSDFVKKFEEVFEVTAAAPVAVAAAAPAGGGAPSTILEGANKETAEKAKAALEAAGGKVTLK
jgi:large subunit ribosomal protein L7/L12